MQNAAEQAQLESAHSLAFLVVGEAFELHFLAGRYAQATSQARRTELAEQFLDHLYALENDFQTLRKAGFLFREMAAYADGRCKIGRHLEASAHSAVASLGLGIVAQCADVMLHRALPDRWPPQTNGEEYSLPDKLPHRQLAAPHAAAVIENFQENLDEVLPLDQLNELSPRLEQEHARLIHASRREESPAPKGRSGRRPTTKPLARYANTRRKRKPPVPWSEIVVEYLSEHPEATNANGDPLTDQGVRDAWRREFGDKKPKGRKKPTRKNAKSI